MARTSLAIDTSMGMMPIGLSGVLFAGDPSVVCQVPTQDLSSKISPCHKVDTEVLPSAGILWGPSETFLLHFKRNSNWSLATINRAYLEEAVSHRRPLERDFPTSLLMKKAIITQMPDNARPVPGFWAADPEKLTVFGHRHLYILAIGR